MILDKAVLTGSGRPVLQAGEVEKALLDKVDLEFDGSGGIHGHIADRYKDGYAILTTHRVLWIEAQASTESNRSCFLPLSALQGCRKETKLSGFRYKTRIELTTRHSGASTPCPEGQPHVGVRPVYLRCYLSPDAFVQAVEDLLRQKSWRTSLPMPTLSLQAAPGPAPNLPPPQWFDASPAPTDSSAAAPVKKDDPSGPQYNRQDLQQLLDMGFPRNRSIRALMATHNSGVAAAMDWILAFGDQPGIDNPIQEAKPTPTTQSSAQNPPPAPSSLSQQGGRTSSRYPSLHTQLPAGSAQLPARSTQLPVGVPPPGYGGRGPLTGGQQYLPQGGQGGHSHIGVHAAGAIPPPPPSQTSLTPWASGQSIPPPPQQVQAQTMSNPLWGLQNPPQPPPPPPDSYPYGYPQPPNPGAGYLNSSSHLPHSQSGLMVSNPMQQAQSMTHPPKQVMRSVGIAGILNREEEKLAGTSRSMEQAFSDLKALMAMAGEMVKLAEKFRGVMGKVGGEEGDDLVDVDTQLQLTDMGILSPVTKQTAGGRYHTELSKQLADFLEKPLANAHGMLTLPDVYCIFNRARGTELVSPDDLLTAIQQFERLGLPMRLRKFSSGVVVVQSAAHSDEEVCARLAELVAGPGCGQPISASEVAVALDIPLHIAQEHLLTAEARGVLCRDDAPAGIRFFRNFFLEVSVM